VHKPGWHGPAPNTSASGGAPSGPASAGGHSCPEAAACALALATGIVPPTINFESPDPECPVDCVPNKAREIHPRVVLNNAYAFGGNNASLCMARFEGGSYSS
jgi:3-oxoacyl-[acyl-carrier-protein] synthase II